MSFFSTSAVEMFCLRPRGASKNNCSLAPVFTCSNLPAVGYKNNWFIHLFYTTVLLNSQMRLVQMLLYHECPSRCGWCSWSLLYRYQLVYWSVHCRCPQMNHGRPQLGTFQHLMKRWNDIYFHCMDCLHIWKWHRTNWATTATSVDVTLRELEVRNDLLPVVKGHHVLQSVRIHYQEAAVIQTHC